MKFNLNLSFSFLLKFNYFFITITGHDYVISLGSVVEIIISLVLISHSRNLNFVKDLQKIINLYNLKFHY